MLTLHQQQLQSFTFKAIKEQQLAYAHQHLVSCIKQNPDDHFCYYLLSEVNYAARDSVKSLKLLEKAYSINAQPLYSTHLAKLYVLAGDLTHATLHFNHAIKAATHSAIESDILANVATRLGDYKAAFTLQQSAFEQAPTHPQITYNLAVAYKINGEFAYAKKLLNELIKTTPEHFQAHYSLAELNNKDEAKLHIKKLNALKGKAINPSAIQMLYHSLALNYEHLNDYPHAFACFNKSKAAISQHLQYQAQHHKKLCSKLITLSNTHQLTPAQSKISPIFVVGMPRSGTTLLEKIINQSEEVAAVGELNDITQLLKKTTNSKSLLDEHMLESAYEQQKIELLAEYQTRCERLTDGLRSCDKQPFNFYYIDFILAAFPKARIICMQRNPLDTCIANYRQLYKPASVFHHYSFDLEDIADFYQDYTLLINHFSQKYPDNVIIQQYEDLVSEPTLHTQALYSFCNLVWQANCLDFYKHSGVSATASKLQVRQPLNSKSIGYWQHYKSESKDLQTRFN